MERKDANMKRNLFFIIAIVCLFFAVPPLDAWAEPSAPTISGDRVYANGTPLIITDGGSGDNTTTTIYIDTNGNGVVDEGEVSLAQEGISQAPADASDLDSYRIYGGTLNTSYTGNTKITILGGTVYWVYGGGYDTNAIVDGSTMVTMSGGNATLIYGGGYSGRVTGSTTVTMSGGSLVLSIHGGGEETGAVVEGNTVITVSGGSLSSIFGGGKKDAVTGNTTVTVSGATVSGSVYGGGGPNANATVGGSATVEIADSVSVANEVCGGSFPGGGAVSGGTSLTVSSAAPARSGYTFADWCTDWERQTPVTYTSGTYTTTSGVTLYSKWTPNNYTVRFDGNSATSGSMSDQNCIYGDTFRLRQNQFANEFAVTYDAQGGTGLPSSDASSQSFLGWAISASGGVIYNDNVQVWSLTGENNGIVTLYAVWSGTFDSVTLPTPTRTGYTLDGWYTAADGGGTKAGDAGDAYTPVGDITLYASWTPNTYTVAFDGNGATGGSMGSQSFTYGTAQVLTANAFERKYTVTYDGQGGSVSPGSAESSYNFLAWETDDVISMVYTDSQSVSNLTAIDGDTVTLYAQWTPDTVTLPTSTRAGFTLTGWYTAADGGGTEAGDADDTYTPTNNITLYADWNAIPNRMAGVTASTTAGVTVSTAYTLDLAAIFEDAEGNPLSYKVSINEGAETVADESYSYTPTVAGTYTLVFKANDGSADSTDTYTVTLTAQQPPSDNGSSGGGGGGGGTTPPPANVDNNTQGTTTITGTTVAASAEGSTATGTVSSDTAGALVNSAKETEKAGNKAVVEIKLETGSDIRAAEITIPKSAFDSLASGTDADLKIGAGIGAVTFDSTAVDTISTAASSGDVTISMAKADTTALPAPLKALVGDRPVYDFTVTAGGQPVSEFGGGKAKISLPYTPAAGEDKNAIVVYYISDSGMLMRVRGNYNDTTGAVEFSTTHFSRYAVGYSKIYFDDVRDTAWYSNAVTFLAAREITGGTGNGNFSPKAKLTRGQFIVMLMRAYNIEPDENPKDNFADAGNNYQTEYLAAAKRLDISQGIGKNQFAPSREISRQEMFTLLYRALDMLGELPEGTSGKAAGDYDDAGQLSAYAKDAVDAFVKAGVISGSGGKLNPSATTTRAEMAQVLYNLLSF